MGKVIEILNRALEPDDNYALTSRVFLKLLALVYFAAFLSLAVQIDGLAGPDGILPLRDWLDGLFAQDGRLAWLELPTLFWFNSSSAALQGAAFGGAMLALFLLLGWGRQRLILILLFVLYLSLYHAGQIFLNFQWDYLLLESGFLAIFLLNAPTRLVIFLYHWLLFRLRFLSGFSKLASGDPVWRDFTTLDYYFETQPLPHIGAWYAHQLPEWLLKTGVGFTFFAELVVPFFIFLPRPFRLFAAGVTLLMQLLIIATSNHNFINLLTILLCLFLLDDKIVSRFLPWRSESSFSKTCLPRISGVEKGLTACFAGLILSISLTMMYSMLTNTRLPGPLYPFTLIGPRYGLGNVYHVFPTMQTQRQELQIAGSYDGVHWEPYQFRYKPDALSKPLAFIVPHQPRLDWMMWFVPLQRPDMDAWFQRFLDALAKNKSPVTQLLAYNPFANKPPPRFLRVVAFRYHFTTPEEHAATGNWWKADYLGEYPNVPPRRP